MATARITPGQVVAGNITRARGFRGWTQEAAAKRLEPYLGQHWSRAVFSAAERSVAGKRIRQFTVDELVALSAAFDFPVGFFLDPPSSVTVAVPGAAKGLPPEELQRLATEDPREAVTRLIDRHYREVGIPFEPSDREEER